MDEFINQKQNNRLKDVSEFNSSLALAEIRNLFRQQFDTIKNMIQQFGHKHAVEDISKIDNGLTNKISDNRLLIQPINRAFAI